MGPRLKPINKELTTQDKVYEQIKNAILYGDVFSEAFTEVQISEMLKTSRTPVRAAIQDLVKEGLLIYIPRKGVTVRKITSEEESEIFLLRSVIESEVIKTLTKLILTSKQLNPLKSIIKQQEEAIKNNDGVRFIELDQEFHITLAKLANYLITQRVLQNLHNLTQIMGLKAVRKQGRMEAVVREHKDIIQAIENKDTELASEIILNHLNKTKETLNEINEN